MYSLGEYIRKLREERALPLRTVAAYLDIDQAILSKIERGLRKANREQVVKLAEFFRVKEEDLLVKWLSDKLVYEVADEELAIKALQVAEKMVAYQKQSPAGVTSLIAAIQNVLLNDGRVAAAWLYGSMATRTAKPGSDVDIIIEFNDQKQYSMFDLLDIAHALENKMDRKVDLVEKGQLKDFALKTASRTIQKIYG